MTELPDNKSSDLYRKMLRATVAFVILLDLYVLSFFIFMMPCQDMNIAPYQEFISAPGSALPPYPSITFICVSRNTVLNEIGYYAYWPVHWCLENRGYWHFVKAIDEKGS